MERVDSARAGKGKWHTRGNDENRNGDKERCVDADEVDLASVRGLGRAGKEGVPKAEQP